MEHRIPMRDEARLFIAVYEEDFVTVTNTVHRSAEHPSHLEIGVLESE